MHLPRKMTALLSALALLLSTLAWWGHHSPGQSADHHSLLAIADLGEDSAPHSHDVADENASHQHNDAIPAMNGNSDNAVGTSSCCAATCLVALAALDGEQAQNSYSPDLLFPVGSDVGHEAIVAKDLRPPRSKPVHDGPSFLA